MIEKTTSIRISNKETSSVDSINLLKIGSIFNLPYNKVKGIFLEGLILTHTNIYVICHWFFAKYNKTETLSLIDCSIEENGVELLFEVLTFHQNNIRNLVLIGCNIKLDDWMILGDTLKHECCRVTSLKINGNGCLTIHVVVEFFFKELVEAKLEGLAFSFLEPIYSKESVEHICMYLKGSKTIRDACFCSLFLDEKTLKLLEDSVVNSGIQTLRLEDCTGTFDFKFFYKALERLRALFVTNTNVTNLKFSLLKGYVLMENCTVVGESDILKPQPGYICLSSSTKEEKEFKGSPLFFLLESDERWGTNLCFDGGVFYNLKKAQNAIYVISAQRNRILKMHVNEINLDLETQEILSRGLSNRNCHIVDLLVTSCSGKFDLKTFGNSLVKLKSLLFISTHVSDIPEDFVISCRNLTSFIAKGCDLDSKALMGLIEALKEGRLYDVDISLNPLVGDEFMFRLLIAFINKEDKISFNNLNIKGCGFTNVGMEMFLNAIERNPQIKKKILHNLN